MKNPFIYIQDALTWLVDILVFVVLFVFNPGHAYSEVTERKLEPNEHATDEKEKLTKAIEANTDTELVVRLLEQNHKEEKERTKTIDEKCRSLLTVAALFLGTCGLMVGNGQVGWGAVIPVLPLALSILLILYYLSPHKYMQVGMADLLGKSDSARSRDLAEQLVEARSDLELRNDYRVAIYRCSLRLCLFGALFAAAILSFMFISPSKDAAKKSADEIKKINRTLKKIEGFRGPRGYAGPKGEQGLPGTKGDRGPEGKQGARGPKGVPGESAPRKD